MKQWNTALYVLSSCILDFELLFIYQWNNTDITIVFDKHRETSDKKPCTLKGFCELENTLFVDTKMYKFILKGYEWI